MNEVRGIPYRSYCQVVTSIIHNTNVLKYDIRIGWAWENVEIVLAFKTLTRSDYYKLYTYYHQWYINTCGTFVAFKDRPVWVCLCGRGRCAGLEGV